MLSSSSAFSPWDDTAGRSSPVTGPSAFDFPASRAVRNKFLFFINYPVTEVAGYTVFTGHNF
jgi:hypothetical protein